MKVAALLMPLLLLIAAASVSAQSVQQVRLAAKADVYSEPAFKSKVLERLTPRALITISMTKIVGKGGLGVFFKVKTPGGKIGFIADGDLVAMPKEDIAPKEPAPSAPATASKAVSNDEVESEPEIEPSTVSAAVSAAASSSATHWGGSLAMLDYTEDLNGRNWQRSQVFFGARRTVSPRKAFRLGNDLNLMLSPWAPKLLADAGARGSTTGFVLGVEWLLYLPLRAGAFVPFVELGPAAMYSSYQTSLAGSGYSQEKTRFGAVIAVGLDYEIAKYLVRLDFNYRFEATSYLGERLSLLRQF